MPKFIVLWTDWSIWLLVIGLIAYVLYVRRHADLATNWRKVFHSASAMSASVVLLACLLVALLDSLHFRPRLQHAAAAAGAAVYDTRVVSILDVLLAPLVNGREKTYSKPLAFVSHTVETQEIAGQIVRAAPRLVYGGAHLVNPPREWGGDVAARLAVGALQGALAGLLLTGLWMWAVVRWGEGAQRGAVVGVRAAFGRVMRGQTAITWRAGMVTLLLLCVLGGITARLAAGYHVLGTDMTGNDVLLQALKSFRTAFVIGTLATLATLPLAVVLGIMAGYFKGWVDEAIQYFYTVLSSIPSILLIAACVLMVQVFLDKHPELFDTAAQRADLKLFLLCLVLGATGWPTLCRLLRGDALKLRELEYVQAAKAFGVSDARIMARHILPNVAHLILIVTVLEFSALILYEAVLAYVGVGVDSSTSSFGGMINLARSEMAREPIIWWSFAAAFVFMVSLVLSANLFADGVRDAFDPRSRIARPRRLKALAPTAAQPAHAEGQPHA